LSAALDPQYVEMVKGIEGLSRHRPLQRAVSARKLGLVVLTVVCLMLTTRRVWADDPMTPARGSFLVASRDLRDPNFRETVVLILEYSSEGAVGLVVNRPSEIPLSRLIPYIAEFRERNDTVYIGGPVEPLRMTFLFRSSKDHENALLVFDDVWASSSFDLLERTLRLGQSPIRVLSGYAGWAPYQLDAEIERGDWRVVAAETEDLFTLDPEKLWRELIQQAELRVVGL
jgi:putative transcriptional regulator